MVVLDASVFLLQYEFLLIYCLDSESDLSVAYSLLSEVLDHQVAAYVKRDFLSNFLYI